MTKAYEKLIKPILFQFNPEFVHDACTFLGKIFGRFWITRFPIEVLYNYKNEKLNINVKGVDFPNPVGLAAGFDKNGVLTDVMPSFGFGFEEVGSITGKQCAGNPKPRLFRLPKDEAIVVHYGLCNDGAEIISEKLKKKKMKIPIGISVAKTNDPSIKGEDSINDYYKAYKLTKNIGNYTTINISCPNAGDGRSFENYILL